MEFSPNNKIVKLCLQGMAAAARNDIKEARRLFRTAWVESADEFESFLSAYYLASQQDDVRERLEWYQTALQYARAVNDEATRSALRTLYSKIAKCHEDLADQANWKKFEELALASGGDPRDQGPFYHGTRADLKADELLTPGGTSNYQPTLVMNHVYFTALANGAGLAASLAKGESRERVYIVEPTGEFENDPNVTDKKFPGNPTRSYRSKYPLRIVGELTQWARQTPEDVQNWKRKIEQSKGEIIN